MTLKRHGYALREAGTVAESIEAVTLEKPDLMLLDMNLPGGTGFDVLMQIRQMYTANVLPIIVISALTQENNIVRALQLGAQDYLTKPFSLLELSERVKRILG